MKPLPLLAAATLSLAATAAMAQNSADVGVLTCTLTGTTNVIIYSNETFDCVFRPNSGAEQRYRGQITSIGANLQFNQEATLVWAVLTSRTDGQIAEQLRGDYVGAGASVAVGGGVGLNALIGGNERAITLQPVSVEGSVGAGAAVGIERFELR